MPIYPNYLQAFEALAEALSKLNKSNKIVKLNMSIQDRADLAYTRQIANSAVVEDGRKFIVPYVFFK